jgi:hypothetical protein
MFATNDVKKKMQYAAIQYFDTELISVKYDGITAGGDVEYALNAE